MWENSSERDWGDKATFGEGLPRIEDPPTILHHYHITFIHPPLSILLELISYNLFVNASECYLQKDYFGLELLDGFLYVHVNLGRSPVSFQFFFNLRKKLLSLPSRPVSNPTAAPHFFRAHQSSLTTLSPIYSTDCSDQIQSLNTSRGQMLTRWPPLCHHPWHDMTYHDISWHIMTWHEKCNSG